MPQENPSTSPAVEHCLNSLYDSSHVDILLNSVDEFRLDIDFELDKDEKASSASLVVVIVTCFIIVFICANVFLRR